jgi:lysine-specific demethylase/histidyl-hydroxylase NO66
VRPGSPASTTGVPTAERTAGPAADPTVALMVELTVAPTVALMVELTVAPTVALMVEPTAGPRVRRTAALAASRASTTVARTAGLVRTAGRVRTAGQTVAQATDLEPAGTPSQGGAADRPALRRCIDLEPDRFATRIWGRDALLSPRERLPEGFADLLAPDAIDRLISQQGLRTPFLRVAKDGQTYPTARFTRPGGVGATISDQVDDAALTRLFADGATIVLQALHRTHAPIIAFAQQLTADLGHPVQVNAYITPPQSRGFSDHYDVHDVFVLQVAGEKRWVIHSPVLEHPRRDQPWTDRRAQVAEAAGTEPLIDVVLRPGDALYLPAGFLHAAQALGETSVHLTFGVHVWTRAHLVDALVARLGDVESLREPLPLGVDVADPASIVLALQQTVDALRAGLPEVPATQLAADLARQAAGASRAAPVGPLAQARALEAVDLWTALRWRPHLRATLTDQGGQLVVRTAEATVSLPAAARRAVERLIVGEVLSAAEFGDGHDGGMEDLERLDVARSLLRSALAVPG